MKLSEKQGQFLLDVASLLLYAQRKGDFFTGGELHRPQEMQEIYRRQGKTLTNESQHLKRLAIDLFLFKDKQVTWDVKDYQEYGKFWESLRPENRWGGNFKNLKDGVHFERRT